MLRNCQKSLFLFHFSKYNSLEPIRNVSRLVISESASRNSKNYCTKAANNTRGVPLSYSTFQPEVEPRTRIPLIFLHGLLGSKQNWRGIAKAVVGKTQRTAYALDARNHGDSPHVHKFSYGLMAEDLKFFMDCQSIPRAVIVGHSMGGRTAMHFALTHEEFVQKLVIVDVSPKTMPDVSKLSLNYMRSMKAALVSISNLSLVKARVAMDEYLSKTIPEGEIRQFLLTNLTEKNQSIAWKPNLDVIMREFHAGILNFPPITGQFTKETLFICGGASPFVKEEDKPFIKEVFPKATFETIPGADHWVHSAKPSEFMQCLSDFLR